MTIRILAADGMEPSAIKELTEKGFEVVDEHYEADELGAKLADFDVMTVRSATKVRQPIIDEAVKAGRLKLVIRGGVGVDNIDVQYAEDHGIAVRNTPKASSSSVAELALGHMFNLARNIHAANVSMRRGEWNKKKYQGIELGGKTLGLIGMGRISREIAKRAHALGMKVIYNDILGDQELPDFEYVSFDEVLSTADFISIHIPKPADRDSVIAKEEIAKMKDGVFLVNTSRGWLIDGDDLMDAIESGKVAGAALDVFREEPTTNQRVLGSDKVSVTPHIGAATAEAQERIGEEIISIITSFFPEA